MGTLIAERWRQAFFEILQPHEIADPLKQSSLQERLSEWTAQLTGVAIKTCNALGWSASAKGHRLELLPMPGNEYLTIDVMAFASGTGRWPFPVAAIELENVLRQDRIAYSLWKVLCVRADLRIVFCYRHTGDEASSLVRFLYDDVVRPMEIATRMNMEGETLIVVGSREDAATFPYGFFKWWRLENNTGTFKLFN